MPFILLIFGEMLLISGIQGTQTDFFNLLKGDFTGANSFIYWLAAIALIGAIGYIPKAKPFSNAFLILVLIVLLINQHTTLFSNLTSALQSTTTAAPTPVGTPSTGTATPATSTTTPAPSTSSTGQQVSNVTDFIGNALQLAGNA